MADLPVASIPEALPKLRAWLAGKRRVVLVAGRRSYAACGAREAFEPLLSAENVLRLSTAGENPQLSAIEGLRRQVAFEPDGFVAIGGGSVIDSVKILRGSRGVPPPFLAMPTTAGTGAEATRFAVAYDGLEKKSFDDVRHLPTDVLLVPELTFSLSPYQTACTGFDAYAQAVESLWAKRATDESRAFALRALELLAGLPRAIGLLGSKSPSLPRLRADLLAGSYLAGKAIDVSRTTAAHALSYYMTARHGIPHGHAVFMMFPYVYQANLRACRALPPAIREAVRAAPAMLGALSSSGLLPSLADFAASRNLDFRHLAAELVAHVNPERLANNPAPISAATFGVV